MNTKKKNDRNLEKYIGGLYQAKPGDYIKIGKEGERIKKINKIKKILPNKKIVDSEGNIFFTNGLLYRGNEYLFKKKFNKGKRISAGLVIQKEFDNEYKNIKIDFLRKYDWNSLDIEKIEEIIDNLPIKQANRLRRSRFE